MRVRYDNGTKGPYWGSLQKSLENGLCLGCWLLGLEPGVGNKHGRCLGFWIWGLGFLGFIASRV